MHNELLTIGPVTIYGYGLMIAIGVIAACWNTERLAKKTGLDPKPVIDLVIVGVGLGFVGSKLLFYITILDEIIKNPRVMLDLSNGFVVYGGLIAGILAAMVYCRIKGLVFLRYLDCAASSIALAQGFGRFGCFLAGCCYGIQVDWPISITFTDSAYAPNHVPLFPSQLASSAFDFLNFFLLCALLKRNKHPGKVGAFYLIFYGVGRFVIEFFRGDLERGSVGTLSTSQFISIFFVLAGVAMVIWLGKRGKAAEEKPAL